MAMELHSELLEYLIEQQCEADQRLPPIHELASILGISSSKLREQLEVARVLELVEIRPKTGIRTRTFSFLPCLRTSLYIALALDPNHFESFGLLRNHLEASFWHEAVGSLLQEDKEHLKELIERAWVQLRGNPIQIPHAEHRDLHLTIFSRIENPFVLGLLEAYWEAYEIVGLNVYSDYTYLEEVWNYHQKMVEAILVGDDEAGYNALVEHIGFLQDRPEMDRFRPSSHVPTGVEKRQGEIRSQGR